MKKFVFEFVDVKTQIVLGSHEYLGTEEEFRRKNNLFEITHPTIEIKLKEIVNL